MSGAQQAAGGQRGAASKSTIQPALPGFVQRLIQVPEYGLSSSMLIWPRLLTGV